MLKQLLKQLLKLFLMLTVIIFTGCDTEQSDGMGEVTSIHGEYFYPGEPVQLNYTGDAAENIEWFLDDQLYSRAEEITLKGLTPGVHTITLKTEYDEVKQEIYIQEIAPLEQFRSELMDQLPPPPSIQQPDGNGNFPGIADHLKPANYNMSGRSSFNRNDAVKMMWYAYTTYLKKEQFINFWSRKGYSAWFYSDWLYSGDVGVVSNADQTVVVFRGSQQIRDWVLDFDFLLTDGAPYHLPGRIHRGQKKAMFHNVWKNLKARIQDDINNGKAIYVTGHSLGGGMATLAAMRLYQAGANVKVVYPFAAVKIGDRTFCDSYNNALGSRTHQILNSEDVVPHLPPAHYSEDRFVASFPWYLRGFAKFLTKFVDYNYAGDHFYLFNGSGDLTGPHNFTESWSDGYWNKIRSRGGLLNRGNRVIFEQHIPDFYLKGIATY